jgi:hypothetical protein
VVGDEPFAVILPDDVIDSDKPVLKQMLEVYAKYGGGVIAVERIPDEDTVKYGVIEPEEAEPGVYRMLSVVEKPEPERAPSNSSSGESSIDLLLVNCVICENQADWTGGGIQIGASEVGDNNTTNVTIINSTITNNSLTDAEPGRGLGGGINASAYSGNGAQVTLDLYNTIVNGNTLPENQPQDLSFGEEDPGNITVNARFCNIGDILIDDDEGSPVWNTTNVDWEDPAFVDPSNNDYHLSVSSPCIDDGTALVPDPPGLPETDLDGKPRVIGTRPDIGAYEYAGALMPAVDEPSAAVGFASIAPFLETAYGYRMGEGTDGWTVYNPSWPAEVNSLETLYVARGYWISVREACTLQYGSSTYELDAPGWWLIGWIPQDTLPIVCLAGGTIIDTPNGPVPVEQLHQGMTVWTMDESGKRIAASVIETSEALVPSNHQVVNVTLNDGRQVTASLLHPTAEGKALGDYCVGEIIDGTIVVGMDYMTYDGDATYDLLPGGPTGLYWANGVLLKGTITGK